VRSVIGQVGYQQVGEHLRGGADADVGDGLAGELADQEDQAAKPLGEPAIGGAIVHPADRFVDLAKELPASQHFGLLLTENVVRRNNRTHRSIRNLSHSVMHNSELRP